MKVSVVMTVLNDRAGCAAALETLLRQSRAPDEVVVVDGGSTDGTREYVASLAGVHPHLRLMVAPDCNIAAGRNLGIAEAAGPIIASSMRTGWRNWFGRSKATRRWTWWGACMR